MNLDKTIEQLNAHFQDLLSLKRAKDDIKTPSFQEIAGYPNYENVLSNIYKFFIESEHHGLEDLFLQALDDCLKEQVALMDDVYVFREYYTHKGGRIDLVISDTAEIENATKVIVIENKIFHKLDNDLEDYWDTFDHVEERVAILLTLEEMSVKLPFVNVTHKQWLQSIKKRIGNHMGAANAHYLIYLNDFINYIDSFYTKTFDMDSLKFLYDNGSKVNELIRLEKDAFNHLRDKMILAIEESDNWTYYKKTAHGVSVVSADGTFLIYINCPSLFVDKTIKMEAWLYGNETMIKWNQTGYNSEIENLAANASIQIEDKKPTKQWFRVGVKEYSIDSLDDLTRLEVLILSHLDNDWLEYKRAILQRLK